MTDTLTERLRASVPTDEYVHAKVDAILTEAADEIDRLTAEVVALHEKCLALEAIDSAAEVRAKAVEAELAEAKRHIEDLSDPTSGWVWRGEGENRHLRSCVVAARAFLAGKPER